MSALPMGISPVSPICEWLREVGELPGLEVDTVPWALQGPLVLSPVPSCTAALSCSSTLAEMLGAPPLHPSHCLLNLCFDL